MVLFRSQRFMSRTGCYRGHTLHWRLQHILTARKVKMVMKVGSIPKQNSTLKGYMNIIPPTPNNKRVNFKGTQEKKRKTDGTPKNTPPKNTSGNVEEPKPADPKPEDASMNDPPVDGAGGGEGDGFRSVSQSKWEVTFVDVSVKVNKDQTTFLAVHSSLTKVVKLAEQAHDETVKFAKLKRSQHTCLAKNLPKDWVTYSKFVRTFGDVMAMAKRVGAKGAKIVSCIRLASKDEIDTAVLQNMAVSLAISSEGKIIISFKEWQCIQPLRSWQMFYTSNMLISNIH